MSDSEDADLQQHEPSLRDNDKSRLHMTNVLTEDRATDDNHEKRSEIDQEPASTNFIDRGEKLDGLDHVSLSEKSDSELSDNCPPIVQTLSGSPMDGKTRDGMDGKTRDFVVGKSRISDDDSQDGRDMISSDLGRCMEKLPGGGAAERIDSVDDCLDSLESETVAAAGVKQHQSGMKKWRKDIVKTLQKKTKVTATELVSLIFVWLRVLRCAPSFFV